MKNEENTGGLLSLEASFALTIFIFLMLFMYSFFVVFEARNEIGHVLLTTADSLALDAFANETLADESVKGILYKLYGSSVDSDGTFTESDKWYEDENQVQEVVEARFIAYMAGGDRDEANKILEKLNVENGIEGLDFSASKVSGSDIILQVDYTLKREFKVFGLKDMKFSQSCCSKLWK